MELSWAKLLSNNIKSANNKTKNKLDFIKIVKLLSFKRTLRKQKYNTHDRRKYLQITYPMNPEIL